MKYNTYISQRNWTHGTKLLGVLLLVMTTIVMWSTPALADQQLPSGEGSVLNVLLLAVFAYFLVRMFRRRMGGGNDKDRSDKRTGSQSDDDRGGRVVRPMDRHEAARQMWGHLSSDKEQDERSDSSPAPVSGEFDEAEFIEGAKLFFSRFQQAKDSRDFEGIRMFLSDDVYADSVLEVQDLPAQARTEIMLLNAKLMEVKSEEGRTRATVFYDAQMRRGVSGEQPVHVRAVWEFVRDDTVENGLWTLDAINKVNQ